MLLDQNGYATDLAGSFRCHLNDELAGVLFETCLRIEDSTAACLNFSFTVQA